MYVLSCEYSFKKKCFSSIIILVLSSLFLFNAYGARNDDVHDLGTLEVFSVEPEKICIKHWTPVIIRLDTRLSSASVREGDNVNFKVVKDVKVDKSIVVEYGTDVRGVVTNVEKPRWLGEEGRISVAVKSVKATDGTIVPLQGSFKRVGEDTRVVALAFCPVVAGKPGVFDEGTEIKAFVDFDTWVQVKN
jgi:hypothetical protein